jgi:pilus assembly protein CpaE
MDIQPGQAPLASDEGLNTREDRGGLLAYVTDADSEAILRDGLIDAGCLRPDIRRGNLRAAIGTLRKTPTPRVLIVDVEGEGDALRALQALSEVAEPSSAVLVIGDSQDMDFYRELTRGLGVTEYLSKPLTRDRVARLFGPVVRGQAYGMVTTTGGRSVTITGASGGVGATTVALNLAWQLAATHRRHTCLLDADLYLGTAALMMDMGLGPGLLSALQDPERIDALFLERAAEVVSEDAVDGRLSLLASETPLADPLDYAPGAAGMLLDAMRMRYNVVVMDTPFTGGQFCRDLLLGATQRVLVLEPTLASIRGALRLADIPSASHQIRRPIMVLNRSGRSGGLSRADVEQTLGKAVDIVIPELPGKVTEAANLGKPLAETNVPFRTAIDGLARQLSIPRLATPANAAAAANRRRAGDKTGLGRFRRR